MLATCTLINTISVSCGGYIYYIALFVKMPVTIRKEPFGQCQDGRNVHKYTFEGSKIVVSVLDFGGAIQSIVMPDRDGRMNDICLGYDNVKGYEENKPYIGVIVGRVAGRIAGGNFELDGKKFQMVKNNGPNNIHGGITGFSRRLWDATIDNDKLRLCYVSPDGEDEFPGEVTMTISYSLTQEGALTIDYVGKTTKPCPLNIMNHAYFNLSSHDGSEVFDHVAQITAERFVPVNDDLVPTGETPPVAGTANDLRSPKRLGDVEKDIRAGDLDVVYAVGESGVSKKVSVISHPPSGRYIETETTEPGLQFYTAKFMADATGKGGKQYQPFCSFCLETQHYPDSVNYSKFPSTILRPGETYRQTTTYTFGAK